jgi:membrane protease YdiL (CAAX protease family)
MMREVFKSYRLPLFFAAAFLFSWYPWFIALARGRTTGPNPLGPLLAAVVITAVSDGWPGVRELLSRIVRWRVPIKWYAVAVVFPVVVSVLAATIVMSRGVAASTRLDLSWRDLLDRFLFILVFVALGEEPGWRGFALEHLQRRHSPLTASLLLAPIWALWHLPLMGNEFPGPIIPAFVLGLFGATLFQTWLYNRTNGSVLLQMLLHATVNTIGAGLVFRAFSGRGLTALWWVYAAIWACVGVLVIVLDKAANSRLRERQTTITSA